jgi:hypothetical protein
MSEVVELNNKKMEDRLKDFSDLLKNLENLTDKKRQLWLEIYENAITDRQHSFEMFMKLSDIAKDKSTEHAVHGRTMAVYLERMSRANDQLIKLAELIAKADSSNDPIDPEDMFERINASKHSGHR